MNGLYSRNVAWILMIVAVFILNLALDQRDANGLASQSIKALQQQVTRAQGKGTAEPVADSDSGLPVDLAAVAAQAKAWREAARSRGSEARQSAIVLDLARKLCDQSGLKECQIRRASGRAASPAAAASSASATVGLAARVMPHGVNVVARFDAKGVDEFSRLLAASGLLYRVERVNIVQNRAEWDVVFLMLSGDAP